MARWIVFSDLDGTLLDARSYDFSAAQPAINFLKKSGIPLVLCTSKTHPEVIALRRRLQIDDPFVVENGSAVFFPPDYFGSLDEAMESYGEYQAIVLGKTYAQILAFLSELKNTFDLRVRGFKDMDLQAVQHFTGLPAKEAELARKRFFSEPFVLEKGADLPDEVKDKIKSAGFRLLRGNRFFHLLGNSDKGLATRRLIGLFKKKWQVDQLTTMGIGDSMNDLEMLREVDIPVLVKKPDGNHQQGIELDNLLLTQGIGPEGWREAIEQRIKS
jgi:mannosyl-3-phosphoglycerate phosphatase